LGHARSFLLAWWSARSRGGRVVLRLEDLDAQRCRDDYVDACLRDLEWLGLDWDGEPLRQSADLEPYRAAVARLLAEGAAYRCWCTRAEIAAVAAPQEGAREMRYPGICRDRGDPPADRPAGVRVRAPDAPVVVCDRAAGTAAFDVGGEVGDFLIQRRDGVYAYQLAVVVDDARQGVTEVLRGVDLLPSAARQQHLYGLLGLRVPVWFHVPLVHDESGRRLAKRRGAASLSALRDGGVDPRALVAWAARSAGQACDERATAGEVARHFDARALPTTAHVLRSAEWSDVDRGPGAPDREDSAHSAPARFEGDRTGNPEGPG